MATNTVIYVVGIQSEEAFGIAELSGPGIPSEEQFGTPWIVNHGERARHTIQHDKETYKYNHSEN